LRQPNGKLLKQINAVSYRRYLQKISKMVMMTGENRHRLNLRELQLRERGLVDEATGASAQKGSTFRGGSFQGTSKVESINKEAKTGIHDGVL